MKSVGGNKKGLSWGWSLINQIGRLLSSNWRVKLFMFMVRLIAMRMHALTNVVCDLEDEFVMFKHVLEFLKQLVIADKCGVASCNFHIYIHK